MSDDTSDIVDRVTRGWAEGAPDVLLGIACREIEELRRSLTEARGLYMLRDYRRGELERELAAMRQQRDEARRLACKFDAINRWTLANPERIISECVVDRMSLWIAVERGWDCFAEKEGGGA